MKKHLKQNGFTLLEALMAMMIMSTALMLLANSWSASFSRVKKIQINFELSSLLERKMSEISREFQGKPIAEIPDEKGEDFEDDLKNYSWKMVAKKFEFPDVSSTLYAKSGGADQMTIMLIKQISDYISKSVKEVTVTITYNIGKKKLEVSATTYFIEYDKPISLSPGSGS